MRKLTCIFMVIITLFAACGCDGNNVVSENKKEDKEKTEIITKVPSNDVTNTINVSVYDVDTFNPLVTGSMSVKEAMKFVYEPLFALDENMNLIPVLADSYSVSSDGKSIDVRLREDVLWHDGSEFGASDVSYTLKAILGGSTNCEKLLGYISGCSVVDKYVVRINMSKPTPNAAAMLTFPILKNNTSMLPDVAYKPIGTGPFAYKGKMSVDRYTLEASDNYYGGKAKLKGVYIDVVPDQRRYHTMFDSGNIDVCNVNLLEGFEYTLKANVNTNEYISDELIYIGINHSSAVLSDKNMRKALSAFIDREAMEGYALYPGVKATDTVISPLSAYSFSDDTALSMDSVKGTEYIKEAGWIPQTKGYTKKNGVIENKLSVNVLVNSDNPEDVKIAQKVKEDIVFNGINVEIQSLNESLYQQRLAAKNYDLYIGREKMLISQDVSTFLGTGNAFGYQNPTIDIIMAEAAAETDKEKISELYSQLHDVLSEDMPIVPLAYSKEVTYMSARIENVSAMGADGFYRDLQKWSIK